ncbi:MAG: hypothetical protein JNM66_18655 [Bryobacterales bacterium]|nr:hypothetical protein [Bryobacterales bacterium]
MTLDATPQAPPPQAVIMDTVFSFFRARTMQVFAELEVADAIAAGREPGVNRRFLDACAAIGLLTRTDEGAYRLTPAGETLRSDVPGSMRGFAAAVIGGAHYKAWGDLAHSARTEACAADRVLGEDIWSYFTKTNPAEGRLFQQAMAGSSAMIVPQVIASYDFPEYGLFVDVAGGNGELLTAILQARPGARGIVMDLPFVEAEAKRNVAAHGVADRCGFVPGDFFQSVPAGGDVYLMKWILHDWSDAKAAMILGSLHRAMPSHAKLLLVETVVPETENAEFGRLMDINMMVMCGGKERTEREWRALLGAAGFALLRVVPMPGPVSIVEAVKQ